MIFNVFAFIVAPFYNQFFSKYSNSGARPLRVGIMNSGMMALVVHAVRQSAGMADEPPTLSPFHFVASSFCRCVTYPSFAFSFFCSRRSAGCRNNFNFVIPSIVLFPSPLYPFPAGCRNNRLWPANHAPGFLPRFASNSIKSSNVSLSLKYSVMLPAPLIRTDIFAFMSSDFSSRSSAPRSSSGG